jgi:hypothetical protein
MRTHSRGQHYAFAHRVLPSLTWSHPDRLLSLLTSSEREAFLQAVWETAGKDLPPSDQVDGATLRSAIHQYGRSTIALITLPHPIVPAEAYFVAIIFDDPSSLNATDIEIPHVRYFTLEFGRNIITQEAHTAVAEWRKDGHYNLGSGPRPESQAFLDHVIAIIEDSNNGVSRT